MQKCNLLTFHSAAEKKKEAPPPPKPAFSFGDIMADLNKQKDPGPPEPAEDKPPETEEERQKRLRKEARRKLRVSWKPDQSLTEVRLFTHDPEEELGPGDRPQREAGDVKGEGRILKLHKDIDELGEEDEGGVREVNLLDYRVLSGMTSPPQSTHADPKLTVLETGSDLTPDDRARNYIKRGGTQEPTSPEKKAQEHREATTLMVFYTSLADVPPSPKEPPSPSEDEIIPDEQAFGELPDHVKVCFPIHVTPQIVSYRESCCRLGKNSTTPLPFLNQRLLPRRARIPANSISPTCSRLSKAHHPSNSNSRCPRPQRYLHPIPSLSPLHLTSSGQSTCSVSSNSSRLRRHRRCLRCPNSLRLSRSLHKALTFKRSCPSSTLKSKYNSRLWYHRLHSHNRELHRTSLPSYPSSATKTRKPRVRPMKILSASVCARSVGWTVPVMRGSTSLNGRDLMADPTKNM